MQKRSSRPDEAQDPESPTLEKRAAPAGSGEDTDEVTSADPVHAYMRGMRAIRLLSRDAEIELAKRMEEGDRLVMAALLGSPIGRAELADLGKALETGLVRLRDVVRDAGNGDDVDDPQCAARIGRALRRLGRYREPSGAGRERRYELAGELLALGP